MSAERYWEARLRDEKAENERLRAIVHAIDEREPGKPTAWRYRREELVEMARVALGGELGEPAS